MTAGDDRVLTEREVALVLKTAAELQARDDAATGGAISVGDLERAAAEAGMDPALIRRAVRQLDDAALAAPHNRLVGGATSVVVERVVDGEVDPAAFERVLDAVRRLTGELGTVSTVGALFGWQGTLEGAKSEVSVSSRDGRTHVRVTVTLDEAALVSFMVGGTLLGGFGGFMTFLASMHALGLTGGIAAFAGAAVAGAGYVGARRHFARVSARMRRRAAAVADAIAAEATRAV